MGKAELEALILVLVQETGTNTIYLEEQVVVVLWCCGLNVCPPPTQIHLCVSLL